jgi:hypothetical protein
MTTFIGAGDSTAAAMLHATTFFRGMGLCCRMLQRPASCTGDTRQHASTDATTHITDATTSDRADHSTLQHKGIDTTT